MDSPKRCNGCGVVKTADQFHRRSDNGRLRSRCKPCMLTYNAEKLSGSSDTRSEEHRAANRERMSRYARGNRQVAARVRRYVESNPQKRRAWAAVGRAVRNGRLIRPTGCACGRTARINAHHDDYAKPLDILWLCSVCHRQRHIDLAAMAVAS